MKPNVVVKPGYLVLAWHIPTKGLYEASIKMCDRTILTREVAEMYVNKLKYAFNQIVFNSKVIKEIK